MPAGRPRKPRETLEAQGSWRAAHAAKPRKGGRPEKPNWLTDRAASFWDEICDAGIDANILTPGDGLMVAMLCEALADYCKYSGMIRSEGEFLESEKGNKYQHPAAAYRLGSWKRVCEALREFGWTPASRSKVPAVGEGDSDPLADLIRLQGQRPAKGQGSA